MRHVYANRATYVLATILVVAVLLFGWLRSRAVVIETEGDAKAPTAPVVEATVSASTAPRPAAEPRLRGQTGTPSSAGRSR
jgi:hypothetical protein